MAGTIDVGALRVTIGADTKPLEEARKKTNREFKTIEKSMTRLRGVALKVGAALGAALAVGKLIAMGRAAIDTADQIGKLSQSLGVSTEFLSQMRHAVELSGASFEQFTTALRQFSRIMGEAVAEPTGRAAEQLRALGISLTDAQGNARSTEAVFMDVANAFASHADGASKAAVAMALFGDEGARLIPLLNSGSAGIREMRDEAHRLGLTLDREATENAARFNDAWTRIQSSTQGFVNIVMKHLLPILERISVGMQRFTQDGEKMKSVSNAISAVMTFLASVLAKVGAEIHGVIAAWSQLAQAFEQFKVGDFSAAWEAAKGSVAAYNAEVERGRQHIKGLWEEHERFKAQANEGPSAPGAPSVDGRPSMQVVSAGESRKELDAMLEQLDLVMDRLNGLPNMIGEAYTINVTGFQDALAAIDQAVMKGALTQQQATRMKLQLTEQEQNAYKQTAQVAAQAITALFPKSKAAGIAAAIINTAVAVAEALKLPPPLNFVQAGLVAAAGAAQVATIASTNMNGGGSVRGVSSGGGGSLTVDPLPAPAPAVEEPRPGTVHKVELVGMGDLITRDVFENLMDQIIEWQRDGGTVVLERA